jgi:hypothetical protein
VVQIMGLVDEQRDRFAASGDDLDELALALLGLGGDLEILGAATPLDALANLQRRRRQPQPPAEPSPKDTDNEVELAYRAYYDGTGEDS